MTGRALLPICLAVVTGVAQVNTGSLIGTITDASRGGITAAKVEIRNLETGSAEAHATNSEGIFRFPFLHPGTYSVRVEAKGFKITETDSIAVLIGKQTTF